MGAKRGLLWGLLRAILGVETLDPEPKTAGVTQGSTSSSD